MATKKMNIMTIVRTEEQQQLCFGDIVCGRSAEGRLQDEEGK